MKKYTRTRIKELNEFAVGGNFYTGNYWLTLYNEDETGNETDTVVINLSRDRLCALIASLQHIQKKPKSLKKKEE
jgi:hypothetical protein